MFNDRKQHLQWLNFKLLPYSLRLRVNFAVNDNGNISTGTVLCYTTANREQNNYKRYHGSGRHPLAYLPYCMPTVSPACAQMVQVLPHQPYAIRPLRGIHLDPTVCVVRGATGIGPRADSLSALHSGPGASG